MNIVIIGQGAIGLLFYNLITNRINTGERNTDALSLRPSYPMTNKQDTYQFTDINGVTSHLNLSYGDDKKVKSADIILLTVKSYQVKKTLVHLSPLLASKAIIILCHNGMGTAEELPKSIIAHHTIIAMLTTHGCLKTSHLEITHTGLGEVDFGLLNAGSMNLGLMNLDLVNLDLVNLGLVNLGLVKQSSSSNKPDNAIISKLEQLLAPAKFHQKIIEKQWQKLAVNCVINPLTAIYDVENGVINDKKYQLIASQTLTEIVAVAKTQGITLNLKQLIDRVQKVAQSTSKNSSSMRCDLNNNKPTEIDYINGFIHRLGQANSIDTPTNSQLWQQILQRQQV